MRTIDFSHLVCVADRKYETLVSRFTHRRGTHEHIHLDALLWG